MNTNRPTLDAASARKIARGQISIVVDNTSERIAKLSTHFPSKRGAWLRAVEDTFRDAYKDTLLTVVSEKRRVLAVYFLPLAEQYEGWLAIEICVASFDGATRRFYLSAISEHAIVRLMQGRRDCSHLDALKDELLEWILVAMLNCIAGQNRPDILCIPTKSGYFTAKWDRNHSTYVCTNWHPDRLLPDKERAIAARLRHEERLGLEAELANCDGLQPEVAT